MALRDWTLTLNGSAQQLSSVLGVDDTSKANPPTAEAVRGGTRDEALRTIILQGDPANTHVVYVGSSSSVSSSLYGVAVPIPIATSNPTALIAMSWSHSGPVKLSDFWVLGTANEKLHILAVPF